MSDVVHAFMESPNWRNGALFVVYDEWGGFFDHVRPPSVADDRKSTNINDDFGLMGYRIPAVAVSPFANRGEVSHQLSGFESIIKLITYRFGLGNLVTRDAQALNIGTALDFTRPDFSVPDLPRPQHIASRPCSLGGGDLAPASRTAHANDLADLQTLARRYGYTVGAGAPSDIYRQPDSVAKALKSSR
jgi:phospholipase C